MAKVRRGDVVILRFANGKARPAVVVQNDHNNGRLSNTILVQVTSNTRLASTEPTQVLIDVTTADGKQSGLSVTSAVKCENIATQPASDIRKIIGRLSASLMQKVDAALKDSLDLA
jgi:mRNA-degrading endonuclease toxin of MazEF toxin-antitoxin module